MTMLATLGGVFMCVLAGLYLCDYVIYLWRCLYASANTSARPTLAFEHKPIFLTAVFITVGLALIGLWQSLS